MTNEEKLKSYNTEKFAEELVFRVCDRVRQFTGRHGVSKQDMIEYLKSSNEFCENITIHELSISPDAAHQILKKDRGMIEITSDMNIGDCIKFHCDDEDTFIEHYKYYITEISTFNNITIASFVPWGKG